MLIALNIYCIKPLLYLCGDGSMLEVVCSIISIFII